MKIPFRRATLPAAHLTAHTIASKPEQHIAVGALAGIAPPDVYAHVLLVITDGGELSITGSTCAEHAAAIVASAGQTLAMRALAAHLHDGEALS